MSKTVADASRDYRQRQRAKLERYEAALQNIVYVTDPTDQANFLAKSALQEK